MHARVPSPYMPFQPHSLTLYIKTNIHSKIKTQKSQFLIWVRVGNIHLTKEDTQMGSKHMRRCSTSLVLSEIKTKSTIRYHRMPIKMAQIQKQTKKRTAPTTEEDTEQQELSFTVEKKAKWYTEFGELLALSYQAKHSLTIWSGNYTSSYLPN